MKEISVDLVSLDKDRMLAYKKFAAAFSYPDDNFFKIFPELICEKEKLSLEYDRLFRANEIWLYGSEYKAENEFQRVQDLADINGFYKAFGLNPGKDRPDALNCELEFMYYLIFKKLRALNEVVIEDRNRKLEVCMDAQKKFFEEHMYSAAKNIAEKIISKTQNNFYIEIAESLLQFLEAEKDNLVKIR